MGAGDNKRHHSLQLQLLCRYGLTARMTSQSGIRRLHEDRSG